MCHFNHSHFSSVSTDTIMNLDDSEQAYNKVYYDEPHHKSSWTHELVANAAGFAGKLRLWDEHSRWKKDTRAYQTYNHF